MPVIIRRETSTPDRMSRLQQDNDTLAKEVKSQKVRMKMA